MEHELHAARLVEEALGDERVLGGERAEQALRLGEVGEELAIGVSPGQLAVTPKLAVIPSGARDLARRFRKPVGKIPRSRSLS
jgi:hypothetical protein